MSFPDRMPEHEVVSGWPGKGSMCAAIVGLLVLAYLIYATEVRDGRPMVVDAVKSGERAR